MNCGFWQLFCPWIYVWTDIILLECLMNNPVCCLVAFYKIFIYVHVFCMLFQGICFIWTFLEIQPYRLCVTSAMRTERWLNYCWLSFQIYVTSLVNRRSMSELQCYRLIYGFFSKSIMIKLIRGQSGTWLSWRKPSVLTKIPSQGKLRKFLLWSGQNII